MFLFDFGFGTEGNWIAYGAMTVIAYLLWLYDRKKNQGKNNVSD